MSEATKEFVFDNDPSNRHIGLGVAAMEIARIATAVALKKHVEEVTIADIANQFTHEGFHEWDAEVARTVRNVLATEYGFDHI